MRTVEDAEGYYWVQYEDGEKFYLTIHSNTVENTHISPLTESNLDLIFGPLIELRR